MHEVTILGCGVAGVVSACVLHHLGFTVNVCDRHLDAPGSAKPEISVNKQLFDMLLAAGLGTVPPEVIIQQTASTLLSWGASGLQQTSQEIWHLNRSALEDWLRQQLLGRGITVRHPVPSGSLAANATFVIDATGRRSQRGERVPLGPPLLGISGRWQDNRTHPPMPYIEASTDCWIWASPASDGFVNVTAFTAPDLLRVNRDAATWLTEALRNSQLSRWTSCSPSVTPIRVFSASPFFKTGICENAFVCTGEAAFAVDPLSSQGMISAARSGYQAAAYVNTIARNADSTGFAATFYQTRVREMATRAARTASAFYAQQACVTARPFWVERGAAAPPPRRLQKQLRTFIGRATLNAVCHFHQKWNWLTARFCVAT